MSGLVGPPTGAVRRRLARGELRTTALHALVVALLASGGLAIALGVHAPRADLAGRTYAAALAACVLAVAVRGLGLAVAGRPGASFEELTARPSDEEWGPPAGLVSLELSVRLGASAAGDYHVRLRPLLTELARQRLAAKGVRLDAPRHRERAEALLGPEVYELVRPGAAPPEERFDPGPGAAALERVTATLEHLA